MKERRLYPRFDVILPVQLHIGNASVEANIFDISQGGMQLGCDRATAEIVVPTPNQSVSPGQNLAVKARFRCPNSPEQIAVECRLVVSRRIADNEYRIGLEFVEFANESDQAVYEAYLQARMAEVA